MRQYSSIGFLACLPNRIEWRHKTNQIQNKQPKTVPKNTSKRLISYMREIQNGVWKLEWENKNEMPTEIVWWCYNSKFSVGFGEPCWGAAKATAIEKGRPWQREPVDLWKEGWQVSCLSCLHKAWGKLMFAAETDAYEHRRKNSGSPCRRPGPSMCKFPIWETGTACLSERRAWTPISLAACDWTLAGVSPASFRCNLSPPGRWLIARFSQVKSIQEQR